MADRDLIARNQALSALILASEQRFFRKLQRRRNRGVLPEPAELERCQQMAQIASLLTRASSYFTDTMRKGGKDLREAGRKFTRVERVKAIAAYLRTLPPAERHAALAELQTGAADG